jgi:hypothetical protein
MANIIEEVIVIKLSRISKSDSLPPLATEEFQITIEQVVQELLSADVVVEVSGM